LSPAISGLARRVDRRGRINALADRRGECIHSACPHFRRCFVEKNVRAARHARLVVANHALVMAQAAVGRARRCHGPDPLCLRRGPPLLEAADSAFSVRLSVRKGGSCGAGSSAPKTGRSRARGLQRRIGDLAEADEEAGKALIEALVAARVLPADGWHQRVAECNGLGGFEALLALVRRQVLARAVNRADSGYGIEAEARPPIDGIVDAAGRLAAGLDRLAAALRRLAMLLRRQLEDPENPPEPILRQRLDAAVRGLDRRAEIQLGAWSALLRDLGEPPSLETVEWLALDRIDGAETDVAVNRNWVDPGIPFSQNRGAAGARHRGDLGNADRRRNRPGTRLERRRGRDRAAPSDGKPGLLASRRPSTTPRRPAS